VTISRAWAIGIGVVLGLAIVLGGYEWLQEHDARLKAESVQTAQQQVIATAQKSIEQAKADEEQTASSLKAQLSSIASQRTIVVTPAQAAAVANTLPNLPAQVQVQQVPATPTAPATQQIVIPQADIPAFQAYKLDCDESSAKLSACTLNAASAAVMSVLVDSAISWNVRATVVSEGTEPNRSSPMRRCSMSRQLSPPPARMRAIWVSTFPRSWSGTPLPAQGMDPDSASPSPNRSAKEPRACSPRWATTPVPPGSTMTRRVLLPFTLEVPFCAGEAGSRQPQFPLLEGRFRGRGGFSSMGGVKSWG